MLEEAVEISRSEFAEEFFHLKGQPFSLESYPHMIGIYDSTVKDIVLKFSRQTAKSTTVANIAIADSCITPFFNTLYVAPTMDQTKVFSNDRVQTTLEQSPIVKQYYINSSVTQNVYTKELLNGSKMYLRYALRNADRIRGMSSDKNVFDEVTLLISL